jgi:hypothetical protein
MDLPLLAQAGHVSAHRQEAPPQSESAGSRTFSTAEDWDSYIDIVLDGDAAAMRPIRGVEIPASGRYGASCDPGGPGNSPAPGVRYTAPGAPQLQPVPLALDDPLVGSYGG